MQTPPYNERNRRVNAVQGMRALLYGETGKQVIVEYLDADDQPLRAAMQFAKRNKSCGQLDPSLPPACAEIEVKRLADGIGYLRFSGFLAPVLDSVLQAIDDLHDAPTLIIDLRGNPGGQFPVRKAIASQLVGDPKLFMRYQHLLTICTILLVLAACGPRLLPWCPGGARRDHRHRVVGYSIIVHLPCLL